MSITSASGPGVGGLYRHLYNGVFRFEQRHRAGTVLPTPADALLTLIVAASLGRFPSAEFHAIEQEYRRTFEPEEISSDAVTILGILDSAQLYPLRTGSAEVETRRPLLERGPILFYLDATSGLDIIDFWNLRAWGFWVFPIPYQRQDALANWCSDFALRLAANRDPLRPHIPEVTFVASRSVGAERMERFARSLPAFGQHALLLQPWYPPLWDAWQRAKNHLVRCDLIAGESSAVADGLEGRIEFSELAPPFADELGPSRGNPRWANVIGLRAPYASEDFAEVIPPNQPELDRILSHTWRGRVWSTREGLVVACEHRRSKQFWALPSATEVLSAWMARFGFELSVSSDGRIARQVARALGGLQGARLIADGEILSTLEKMARGATESTTTWMGILRRANSNRERATENHLRALTTKGVLRVGLRVQCSECGQHTWFDLPALSDSLRCERCLQTSPFPLKPPRPSDWHYRAVGPFSIPGFAQGSYAVILALRFLSDGILRSATWVPACDLARTGHTTLSPDFALFLPRNWYEHPDPILVIGECKSYDRCYDRDVGRLRALGNMFPGSALVFATLRPALAASEKRLIATLARRGRRYFKADQWWNPVLVLTGAELFSELGPPYCWKDRGGKFDAVTQAYERSEGFLALCDATQQLHLDMKPYWTQMEEERRQRELRVATRGRRRRGS